MIRSRPAGRWFPIVLGSLMLLSIVPTDALERTAELVSDEEDTTTLIGDIETTVQGTVPVFTDEHWGSPSNPGRAMVLLNSNITAAILNGIGDHSTVHGWLDRYRIVAVSPHGEQGRRAIAKLPYVEFVESDQPRYRTAVGTWDRDLLDIVDVEESGGIAPPDMREVPWTGAGITVAVLDTGLPKNWRDFLPAARINTALARAVQGGGADPDPRIGHHNEFNTSSPTHLWERDTQGHGMAVASHIIGFSAFGLEIDGAAPGATILPIKVLGQDGAGWSSQIIAGIEYVIGLVNDGLLGPTVINMSLGGGFPSRLEERAIDDAIAAGVLVVASAGNNGERFMGWPGAFPQVISAGAVGWTKQWRPGSAFSPNGGFWITQDVGYDPDPALPPMEASEAWVAGFSSRAAIPELIPGFPQQLDVMAPGSLTVAPYGHGPGAGIFFLGGTSFASPLTAGVVALIREKNPSLGQAEVEAILKSTAQPMGGNDARVGVIFPGAGVFTVGWDMNCGGIPCDPVGAGLLQADAALAATP